MQLIRNIFPNQGTGKLEIQPYNGLDNIIIYKDARLLSVDLPEQQENSAGVQNFEYNFVFEAYQEESVGTNIDTLAKADPTYLLESVSENWDLNENDGIFRNRLQRICWSLFLKIGILMKMMVFFFKGVFMTALKMLCIKPTVCHTPLPQRV